LREDGASSYTQNASEEASSRVHADDLLVLSFLDPEMRRVVNLNDKR
jgi:hypothetical protein